MDRRTSIADHVIPRTPRAAVAPPVVPPFEELWPDSPVIVPAAAAPVTVAPVAPVAPVPPAAPVAPVAPAAPAAPAPAVAGAVVATPAVADVVVDAPVVVAVTPEATTSTATLDRSTDWSAAGPGDTDPDDAPLPPAARRDVRPLTAVPTLRDGRDGAVPAARSLTTFPASVVETHEARIRLAAPVADRPADRPADRDAARDPRDAQVLGVRHEARHQAARTDLGGLHDMMKQLLAAGGSDLHLTVGVAPTMRVHGDLRRIADHAPMAGDEIAALLRGIVDGEQWHTFETTNELDLAYTAPEIGRFRVNLYRQRGVCGAAFRAIPTVIPELSTLGLPPQVEQFAGLPRGLVLVTGPTGSGKTTTLAALLALANRMRSPHIVTIEDPIEFLHEHGHGLVNQREVGGDTASFAAALKHALRQDPDVILVGELRDLETTATALTAAETGHLVFATLHTQSAAQTVDRIIDIFPAHQQGEVRSQLASTLRGVVTQALAPRSDGSGRAVVAEVMVATPAVRNLIREGKTHQIPSFMQAGGRDGMLTFDQHLAWLVRAGTVGYDRALTLCQSVEDFARLARTVSA